MAATSAGGGELEAVTTYEDPSICKLWARDWPGARLEEWGVQWLPQEAQARGRQEEQEEQEEAQKHTFGQPGCCQ